MASLELYLSHAPVYLEVDTKILNLEGHILVGDFAYSYIISIYLRDDKARWNFVRCVEIDNIKEKKLNFWPTQITYKTVLGATAETIENQSLIYENIKTTCVDTLESALNYRLKPQEDKFFCEQLKKYILEDEKLLALIGEYSIGVDKEQIKSAIAQLNSLESSGRANKI